MVRKFLLRLAESTVLFLCHIQALLHTLTLSSTHPTRTTQMVFQPEEEKVLLYLLDVVEDAQLR